MKQIDWFCGARNMLFFFYTVPPAGGQRHEDLLEWILTTQFWGEHQGDSAARNEGRPVCWRVSVTQPVARVDCEGRMQVGGG